MGADDDGEIRHIASRTRPGVIYATTAKWCECPAGRHGRACYHRKKYMEDEMAAAKPAEAATPADIHQAIAAVYGKTGYVQKEAAKPGLGYSYAGIAALIYHLRPVMVEFGVYMHVAEVTNVHRESFTTKNGGNMNRTTLNARIRFTHGPSGTYIECMASGEGMDNGDKSSNKAMTGAFKYALLETFCIETGDDPDDTNSNDQEQAPPRPVPTRTADGRDVDTTTGEIAPPSGRRAAIDAAQAVVTASNDARIEQRVAGQKPKEMDPDEFIAGLKALIESLSQRPGTTPKSWADIGALLNVEAKKAGFKAWLFDFQSKHPDVADPVAYVRDWILDAETLADDAAAGNLPD